MKSDLLICISREFGSGGHEIGKKLADRLGIPLIDKEIVDKASLMGKLDKSYFKDSGDSSGNTFIFSKLGNHPSYSSDPSSVVTSQKLFYLQSSATLKIAKEENCGVFIGRCADIVLDNLPNCHSFFIHSPLHKRVERIKSIYNIKDKEAENLIKKTDKQRSSYYNYYAKLKWGHPSNYEMILNSDKIGIDKTVKLISLYTNMEE